MAPVKTVLTVLTLALSASAALHETRSRQNAADVAARRVGAIASREVALSANDSKPAHKKRTHKKKRCGAHKGGSGSSGSSSGSSGSSSSGSGSSGSGVASGGGGAGTVHVTLPTSGFQGPQDGAIMSWFRANSGQDSTNGRSWCGIEYTDDMPLFAPDMKTLSPSLATYSSDPDQWRADGTKWCGLQAKITYKGKSTIGYIGDAFDPTWVKTPTSIDVLYNLFTETYGSDPGDNKDIVGEGVTWELTGYRKTEYAFQG